MKEIIINKNDANQRLDKFLQKALPNLPASLMYKYIRKKRIKLNQKHCQNNSILQEGDVLQLFINDEFFEKNNKRSFLNCKIQLQIVFEDDNILVVNKPSGLLVHEDKTETVNTLINGICKYLWQKNEYDPEKENSFTPALCHRIDRNTSGLVIAAKNAETLRILNEKFKNHEIIKKYICLVHGNLTPKEAILQAYLKKDADKNQVIISNTPKPGYKIIKTGYKVLQSSAKTSLLEVTLFTGRTHQIRAQFAHIGHPLIGDNKYGRIAQNKNLELKHQALIAFSITFKFKSNALGLNYLNNLTLTLNNNDLKILNHFV
ncbi:MAG: RluA family pseudouridine synthase [Oscillospiraceae bacterium]|nr:RluA family pseudouridine synthase [Oscillospiraceae bacterium]